MRATVKQWRRLDVTEQWIGSIAFSFTSIGNGIIPPYGTLFAAFFFMNRNPEANPSRSCKLPGGKTEENGEKKGEKREKAKKGSNMR